MATTTNYSWETPDDTDLVKDGAAAIRTLGSSIDTTTKALNPSTTLGDIEYRSSTANTNTRLGIGSTGQVLTVSGGVPAWSTPTSTGFVGAKVYKSAAQSIANATFTALSFDSESFDTDAFHDNSTNNSRITIPSGKAGKYAVQWQTVWAGNATGSRNTKIQKNGSDVALGIWMNALSGVDLTVTNNNAILNLAEGDYLQVFIGQGSGGNLDANSGEAIGCTFAVTYLGA